MGLNHSESQEQMKHLATAQHPQHSAIQWFPTYFHCCNFCDVIKAFFVTNGSGKKAPANNGDGSEEKIKKYNKASEMEFGVRCEFRNGFE